MTKPEIILAARIFLKFLEPMRDADAGDCVCDSPPTEQLAQGLVERLWDYDISPADLVGALSDWLKELGP